MSDKEPFGETVLGFLLGMSALILSIGVVIALVIAALSLLP